MIEGILIGLLEPASKLGVDGKTSVMLVIIIYGAVHFIKQHKRTQKEITEIKEILDKKLKDCENELKECRHDKAVITKLYDEIRNKQQNLENRLTNFINSKN